MNVGRGIRAPDAWLIKRCLHRVSKQLSCSFLGAQPAVCSLDLGREAKGHFPPFGCLGVQSVGTALSSSKALDLPRASIGFPGKELQLNPVVLRVKSILCTCRELSA